MHTFSSSIPIPSYLIALAGGDLEYKEIGSRTGVIALSNKLNESAEVLSGLEGLLDDTEKYMMTPYVWGKYNILVLPPSFPTGGMENPYMTFASPTIITQDRSQIYVAAHEIAHSWVGNLVTGMNWSNFWLNEGFAVFVENKISSLNNGTDFGIIEASLGNADLLNDLRNLGMSTTYTTLNPQYNGSNPYDTFSTVPYQKGFQFLKYLESLVGNVTM